ncbi:hypothetical protein PENARI_c012G03888 [Penicillium arizonense]|uniref:Zn(2)-C6 fungal-type domain-containing protein n=1 Tax=Penicillium arizonense TaxID=1835702 RepID=A0A1F5LFW2_PENAI|nr:hypothetical protein PENARI_c012G03888 [Penicillium arizonense]OGE51789.1 hypothetical protein PENARI_c012G03888 [Penicillium arizonense]
MSSAKATKKSAFSCAPCRKRKVKCGGEQPVCKRCVARDDMCVYKLSPTLSYTQRLENRIKELEDELAELKGKALASRCVPENSSSGWSIQAQSESGHASGFGGLKLDEKGVTTYHGAASFFHLLGDNRTSTEAFQDTSTTAEDLVLRKRETLVTNAWRQRALENISEIPEPFQYLLDTHWCWIQPLFNFIYRPAFTRDMEVLGSYYSHTLLNAVLSHSIRWGKSDKTTCEKLEEAYESGAIFGRHARTLLFDELSSGICTIPTVQTLLLLSAQECSSGNSAQAWVYTGIAFRLIDHLGICVDSQRYAGSVELSDEDVEIRNRLFWSCYFWDKMLSVYLGRSPTLQHSTVSPPQIMFDDSSENELWYPHSFSIPGGVEYPPTPSHSTSCFVRMSQLSVIFNQILIHMYDPLQQHTETDIQACFVREDTALHQWWDDLPPFLKIDVNALPVLAPPSHILPLPYLQNSITSSNAVSALSPAYVYIAASIFLLQVQAASDDKQALRRLGFCIHALERVKTINPVIGSALKLITRALQKLGIEASTLREQLAPETGPFLNRPMSHFAPQPLISQFTQQSQIDDSFQLSEFDYLNAEIFEITPEQFEVVSSMEPITVMVGALNGSSAV